jgi:hypothetical protein
LEPEIEEILPHDAGNGSSELDKPILFVQIDGKVMHKASILRLYSHHDTQVGPSLTDRLKHV